jgi:A118 family predicted phage portal protein
MKTATEVISENSKTFKTKQAIENQIKYGTINIMNAIRELGRLYNIGTTTDEYDIIFNDSVIEDRNSKTKYYTERFIAGTITLKDYLIAVDNLPEDEAEKKEIEDTLKNLENLFAKKLISKELFQANVKELKAKLKLGGKI